MTRCKLFGIALGVATLLFTAEAAQAQFGLGAGRGHMYGSSFSPNYGSNWYGGGSHFGYGSNWGYNSPYSSWGYGASPYNGNWGYNQPNYYGGYNSAYGYPYNSGGFTYSPPVYSGTG